MILTADFDLDGEIIDMNTITLSASSNIARSADVYTSKDGRDVGSTFFSFTCLICDASLGIRKL